MHDGGRYFFRRCRTLSAAIPQKLGLATKALGFFRRTIYRPSLPFLLGGSHITTPKATDGPFMYVLTPLDISLNYNSMCLYLTLEPLLSVVYRIIMCELAQAAVSSQFQKLGLGCALQCRYIFGHSAQRVRGSF